MNYHNFKKAIIAHRGAPRLARENTILAFQKALDMGADAIELDVRQTRDGVLAVFHDEDIAGRPIESMDFFELNRLASKQDFSVPALGQALQLIAGKADLQIEIKAPGYESQTAETALKFLQTGNFEIISFNFESLKKIKSNYPRIRTGLILGSEGSELWQTLNFLARRRKYLSYLDSLCVNYKLWQCGILKFIPKNYSVTVWTADEPELIKALLKDERIKSITSNLPDLALKLRNSYGKPQ